MFMRALYSYYRQYAPTPACVPKELTVTSPKQQVIWEAAMLVVTSTIANGNDSPVFSWQMRAY